MASKYQPGDIVNRGIVSVKMTHAGPVLRIGDVDVRTWLGCVHDQDAVDLATRINDEIWRAAVAD